MALEGHIDFYGYHADVAGWLFSGWSDTWLDNGEKRSVTAVLKKAMFTRTSCWQTAPTATITISRIGLPSI